MKFVSPLLLILSVNIMAGDGLMPVFNQYADLQSALAMDHLDHAKMSAGKLQKLVDQVDVASLDKMTQKTWEAKGSSLKAALSKALKASDIKDLRVQFNAISETLIQLGSTSGTQGLNQFHCPMAFGGKGADWLQKGDGTKNPYYGSAMLKCGSMVKAASKKDMDHKMDHGHKH